MPTTEIHWQFDPYVAVELKDDSGRTLGFQVFLPPDSKPLHDGLLATLDEARNFISAHHAKESLKKLAEHSHDTDSSGCTP